VQHVPLREIEEENKSRHLNTIRCLMLATRNRPPGLWL